MPSYSGTMTEVKRVDNENAPSVVVSYWTNDEGERYEPRLRFVIGDKSRPVKGLTRVQALAVRDAFNSVCAEWENPTAAPKTKRKTSKRTSKKAKATASRAASEAAAAVAISDMFKDK